MVEIRRLKPNFREFPEFENPDSPPPELFETISEIAEEDQIIESSERDSELLPEEYDTGDCNDFIQNFTTLRKVQEALDQISYTLGNFLREREYSALMDRNIFSLNNRGMEMNATDQGMPLEMRLAAYLLSQGDNRRVEDLIRTVNQNVVVNVNLSYYFKIMLIMLTVNTLLLFKWIVWDQFPDFL